MSQFTNAFMQGMSWGNRAFEDDRQYEFAQQQMQARQQQQIMEQQFQMQQQMAEQMEARRKQKTSLAYLDDMQTRVPQDSGMYYQLEQAKMRIASGADPDKALSSLNLGSTYHNDQSRQNVVNEQIARASRWRMDYDQAERFHEDSMAPKPKPTPAVSPNDARKSAYASTVGPLESQKQFADEDFQEAKSRLDKISTYWVKVSNTENPSEQQEALKEANDDAVMVSYLASMFGGGTLDSERVNALHAQAKADYEAARQAREKARAAYRTADTEFNKTWPKMQARAIQGAELDPNSPMYADLVSINPDKYAAPQMQQPQQQPAQQPTPQGAAQAQPQQDPQAQMRSERFRQFSTRGEYSIQDADVLQGMAAEIGMSGDEFQSLQVEVMNEVRSRVPHTNTQDFVNEVLREMSARIADMIGGN